MAPRVRPLISCCKKYSMDGVRSLRLRSVKRGNRQALGMAPSSTSGFHRGRDAWDRNGGLDQPRMRTASEPLKPLVLLCREGPASAPWLRRRSHHLAKDRSSYTFFWKFNSRSNSIHWAPFSSQFTVSFRIHRHESAVSERPMLHGDVRLAPVTLAMRGRAALGSRPGRSAASRRARPRQARRLATGDTALAQPR